MSAPCLWTWASSLVLAALVPGGSLPSRLKARDYRAQGDLKSEATKFPPSRGRKGVLLGVFRRFDGGRLAASDFNPWRNAAPHQRLILERRGQGAVEAFEFPGLFRRQPLHMTVYERVVTGPGMDGTSAG